MASVFPGNPKESPIYNDISEGIAATGAEYYLPLFFPQLNTLFDYVPAQTKIICTEPLPALAEKFWQEVNHRYEQLRYDIKRPLCAPNTIFLASNEFFAGMKSFPQIQLHHESLPEKQGHYSFATLEPPSLFVDHKAKQPLHSLQAFLNDHSTQRILFCAETTGRREILLELFTGIHLQPSNFSSWQEFLNAKAPARYLCCSVG